jgi:hypothetical protein
MDTEGGDNWTKSTRGDNCFLVGFVSIAQAVGDKPSVIAKPCGRHVDAEGGNKRTKSTRSNDGVNVHIISIT